MRAQHLKSKSMSVIGSSKFILTKNEEK